MISQSVRVNRVIITQFKIKEIVYKAQSKGYLNKREQGTIRQGEIGNKGQDNRNKSEMEHNSE